MNHNMQQHPFHLVTPSPWPILAALGAFMTTTGGVMYMHFFKHGGFLLSFGLIFLTSVLIVWWRDVIRESTWEGTHTTKVGKLMYSGMTLFIISEIMFFCAFFFLLVLEKYFPNLIRFYASAVNYPPPDIYLYAPPKWFAFWLAMLLVLSAMHLDEVFEFVQISKKFKPTPGGIILGTLIERVYEKLGLRYTASEKNRIVRVWYKIPIVINFQKRRVTHSFRLSIICGTLFLLCQIFEYCHNVISINNGLYTSLFYIITGFHGFHVIIGLCFIIVCYLRFRRGHYDERRFVALDLARWYWHFVDEIWVFVFVVLYTATSPYTVKEVLKFTVEMTVDVTCAYKHYEKVEWEEIW